MRQAKALSFDGDGTLFGTFPESSQGFERFFLKTASAYGKKVTLEFLQPIFANLKNQIAQRKEQGFYPYINEENSRLHWFWYYQQVFTSLNLPNPKELAEKTIRRFESGEFTRLYPDTLPCLRYFRRKKIPMILISNYAPLLKQFLIQLGIAKFFQATVISGMEGIQKPNPRMFEKGAEALSLPPETICHVGNDWEEDFLGAKNAGFQAILLDRDGTCQRLQIPKIRSLKELYCETQFPPA